ncbi:dehydrogenase [bacterium]|nr:MAG: dehydrogenase [bacterium]
MNARIAIFDKAGQAFRLEEWPVPEQLATGEVLVEIALATICGSDLHTVAGKRQEPTPCVLGHEGVGHVVAVGAGREEWRGRRVTWTLADSCGHCAACTQWDLPQKCRQLFKYGHAALATGSGLNGTYGTHVVLRPGTHLVEIPDSVSDSVAASANCSLATMVAVTETLPSPCRVAIIQGAGLLGLHACALLRDAGIERVIVVDVDAGRLAKVPDFGGEPARSGEVEAGSADLVIEVAGVPAVVAEGMKLLRPGGHYFFVGMAHPDSALNITGEALIRGCTTMRGFHNYAPRHLDRAVEFLANSPLPWQSLVSPPLPLDQLDAAFALAKTRQWARVAVQMQR